MLGYSKYDIIITLNDTLIIMRSPQKSIGNNFRPFYSNFGLGTGRVRIVGGGPFNAVPEEPKCPVM